MIVSVSRRTDIPAFYMDWFMKRVEAGYVLSRNPMNRRQVSRIDFSDVSCLVFWTKNPEKLVKYHDLIKKPYFTHVTITSYMKDVEKNIDDKNKIIESAIELSRLTDNKRVIWRYDPIIFNDKYTEGYHLHYFEKLCKRLEGHVTSCIISFLEPYKKIEKAIKDFQLPSHEKKTGFVGKLHEIAKRHGICLRSCGDYEGIEKAACIDKKILAHLNVSGYRKDRYQRASCNCMESVDIGSYNTCLHHCTYCYANSNHDAAFEFHSGFNDDSEILGSPLLGDETIKRKVISRKSQISLFDIDLE